MVVEDLRAKSEKGKDTQTALEVSVEGNAQSPMRGEIGDERPGWMTQTIEYEGKIIPIGEWLKRTMAGRVSGGT